MTSTAKPRNRLLAALSPADLLLLQPHLTPVTLKLRQDLKSPITEFPTFISSTPA